MSIQCLDFDVITIISCFTFVVSVYINFAFQFLSAFFCGTFLSAGIDTFISMRVIYFLFLIIIIIIIMVIIIIIIKMKIAIYEPPRYVIFFRLLSFLLAYVFCNHTN